MTWQTLAPVTLNKPGDYVPIPLAGAGGRVPIEIPAFPANEAGRFEVGVYSLPPGPGASPGVVATPQTGLIGPYKRYFVFEVPPNTASPHLGVRLLQHSDLDNKAYEILARWQEPYGSGTGNGGGTPVPSGFVAAISWQEIKAAAISEIAQGYATVESVATQLAEIQEAIDALAAQNTMNAATQQAIAALATRINALESSDPGQAEAIATLQQSLSALQSSGATDQELADGLAALQAQLDALASDSELAAALGPIQSAIDGLGGTYATDSELAAAIATEATARQQAIASIVPSGTDGNLLQRVSNGISAIAGLLYVAATNILTLPGGIRIRPSSDSTNALEFQSASGNSLLRIDSTNSRLVAQGATRYSGQSFGGRNISDFAGITNAIAVSNILFSKGGVNGGSTIGVNPIVDRLMNVIASGATASVVSGSFTGSLANIFNANPASGVSVAAGATSVFEIDFSTVPGLSAGFSNGSGAIIPLFFTGQQPQNITISVFSGGTYYQIASYAPSETECEINYVPSYPALTKLRVSITAKVGVSTFLSNFFWFASAPGTAEQAQHPLSRSQTRQDVYAPAFRLMSGSNFAEIGPGYMGASSLTVAQLNALPGKYQGMQSYCSNESGGPCPVHYNGTNWQRVSDNAIIS